MNRTPTSGLGPLLALAALAVAACDAAWAASPPPGATGPLPPEAYASGSASASALPPEEQPKLVDGRKPWQPDLSSPPPPVEKSDEPTSSEWSKAPAARDVRITQPNCEVRRLREWYRVSCGHLGAELVSGARAGVAFHPTINKDGFTEDVAIVFPARVGDRRIFQLYGWSKWAPGDPDAIVSEQWLEGDPRPLISIQGIRWL